MKKYKNTFLKNNTILLFFIVYLIFSVKSSYAEESSCKIEDSPAPVLEEYFENVEKVVANVRSSINREKDKVTKKNIIKWEAIRIFNMIPSRTNYFSTFDYYGKLIFTTEIPRQVKRDYDRIDEELDSLSDLLSNISSNWLNNVKIEAPCLWVSWNCELKWNAWYVLWQLIQSTDSISRLFRLSIMDRRPEFRWDIILVWDNFIEEFWNYYNHFTLVDCSKNTDDWFLKRVNESISKIWDKSKRWYNWMKDWKEAWALLTWTIWEDEYKEKERDLLKNELSRQWLSSDNSSIILWNLEKYNWWWISADNNFITNSFESIKKKIKDQVDEFNNTVLQVWEWKWDDEEIPVEKITQTIDKNTSSNDIEKTIAEIYEKSLPSASLQDVNTEKIMQKCIDIHISLTQAIETLEKTVVLSRKVCNEQDRWNWICE